MKGYTKRSVEISDDTLETIERYAEISYMKASAVIRMVLDKWAKNARYTIELNEGITCPDREDPTV